MDAKATNAISKAAHSSLAVVPRAAVATAQPALNYPFLSVHYGSNNISNNQAMAYLLASGTTTHNA